MKKKMLKNGKIRVETVKIGEQKKKKNLRKKQRPIFLKNFYDWESPEMVEKTSKKIKNLLKNGEWKTVEKR